MINQWGKNLRNATFTEIAIECDTKPISGVQNPNVCGSCVGNDSRRSKRHVNCKSITANIIILSRWYIMTSSSLPFASSAVSDAACTSGGHIPADLRSLAIQSLQANANFHGRLASVAIQIETNDGRWS